MLERVLDLPAGIDGIRAKGRVSKQDYDTVLAPLLEEARRGGRRIRLLYHFPPDFAGFTPGGAWEDAEIGLRHLRLFERCAIISDSEWIRGAVRAIGTLLPCPLRVFREAERDDAVAWLSAPAASTYLDHRLLADRDVLIVEPRGRLRVEDFDAIAITVDPWIESGHELYGVVVHAKEFSGWESIGSFLRHIEFVRNNQRRVQRVALAADGKIAKLAPALVENFVGAQIQHFGFSEIDPAIEWASRPGAIGRATG